MPANYQGFGLGLVFQMTTSPNPKARQINAYPGSDGLQVIDHGARGGSTLLLAAFGASTPGGLAATEGRMFALQQDGRPGTLVDDLDRTWSNVILVTFRTQGRVERIVSADLPRGGYGRVYVAEFLHIS